MTHSPSTLKKTSTSSKQSTTRKSRSPAKSPSGSSAKSKSPSGSSAKSVSSISDSPSESLLPKLNQLLQKKCPTLELRVGLLKEMEGTVHAYNTKLKNSKVICLYDTSTKPDIKCVSSIILKENTPTGLSLFSATETGYNNKKYNTLLRMVAVILATSIYPSTTELYSDAVSNVSAHLMMKYFNVLPNSNDDANADFFYFVKKELPDNLHYPDDAKRIVSEFYKKYSNDIPIEFVVPLDKTVVDNAMHHFKTMVSQKTTSGITCP